MHPPVTLSDSASPIPTFTPGTPGPYTFGLVVTNSSLGSRLNRVTVLIKGASRHPFMGSL